MESKTIKKIFKERYGLDVRCRTVACKNRFVSCWTAGDLVTFPEPIRAKAIAVEYPGVQITPEMLRGRYGNTYPQMIEATVNAWDSILAEE